MYKLKIKKYNDKNYEGNFKTLQELETWKDKHIQKNTWGKPARTVEKDSENYDPSLIISEYQINVEDEVVTMVNLKAEYEILPIEDLTEETVKREKIAKIQKGKNHKHISFGKQVLGFLGDLNENLNLDHASKDSLESNAENAQIIKALELGRIGKAKKLLDALDVNSLPYNAEDIQDLKDAIDAYVELEM